jgi:hypothetical protein
MTVLFIPYEGKRYVPGFEDTLSLRFDFDNTGRLRCAETSITESATIQIEQTLG